MTNPELLSLAKAASHNAYAKYSNFAVGAALLCENGDVYTGCNIENSCGTSVCAERAAIANAIIHGNQQFSKMAIFSPHQPNITPCGICRQYLIEFNDSIKIITETAEYDIKNLLPHSFHR
ncbi:MAG: cytidine deaminase [Clostridiales bacterium]|jgi:cytidine deaminase|nr:cytidine deaminase [Clostridiales bacterium]